MNSQYDSVINDYFGRIKAKLSVSDLFATGATIISHKFGELSPQQYDEKLQAQDGVSTIEVNLNSKIQADDVVVVYLEFVFNSVTQRRYIDVFQFMCGKILNLYLNRLA